MAYDPEGSTREAKHFLPTRRIQCAQLARPPSGAISPDMCKTTRFQLSRKAAEKTFCGRPIQSPGGATAPSRARGGGTIASRCERQKMRPRAPILCSPVASSFLAGSSKAAARIFRLASPAPAPTPAATLKKNRRP